MVGLPIRAVKSGGNAGGFCSVTQVASVTLILIRRWLWLRMFLLRAAIQLRMLARQFQIVPGDSGGGDGRSTWIEEIASASGPARGSLPDSSASAADTAGSGGNC